MKKLAVLTLSVVTILASVVTVFAQAPSPGQGTSYGAVQNVGCAGDAHFVQEFYDGDGNVDATREKMDVACGDTMGLTANQTTDAPLDTELPTGWAGSSVVSSDQEAAAVVLIQWTGGGIGADGVTTADYVGELNPGSDVFCPSVGKRSIEDSTLVVMNTSDTEVTDVSISFKDRLGADVGTAVTGLTIPARAQVTHNLYEAVFNLPDNFLGAARVQSAGGTELAVVAYTHWGSAGGAYGTFAYNCAPTAAAATTLYAPKVQRRAPSWNGGNWVDASGIIVVNTEATAADVTVAFYDRDGAASGTFTDTVPGFSARGYNTRYVGNADATVIDGLVGSGSASEPNWQGSVVVTSDTGEAIVGVVKQGYDTDLWAGGYNMLSDADAAQTWSFPLVYRRGFNKPWTDYIGVVCQNVSASDIAPELDFVDRRATATSCTASTTACTFTDAVPFGQYVSHGYNTRYGGAQAATWFDTNFSANFIGAATAGLSSGSMVCIQETWAEEIFSGGAWIDGGDANLNNAYGQ
jgi:hypothetical protein